MTSHPPDQTEQKRLNSQIEALKGQVATLRSTQAKHARIGEIQQMQRDLAAWLSVCPDLQTAGKDVLEQLIWLEGIDYAALHLSNGDGHFELVAEQTQLDNPLQRSGTLDSTSALTRLIRTNDALYFSRSELQSNNIFPIVDREPGRGNLGCGALLPLKYGGEIEAVLVAVSISREDLPDFIRDLLESIAALTAGTIARLRAKQALEESERRFRDVAEELKRHRDNLEELVAERTADLSRANERLKREVSDRHRAEEEKEKLESQLRQSQKMQAIGALAGGIAHDFNNILSSAMGFTELAISEAGDNVRLGECLEHVSIAHQRAADLVRQILTFSRQAENTRRPIRLQPVVKEVIQLLRSTLPTTIRISPDISADCGPVAADLSQIHQVVMNLCTNAYHAMRAEGGLLAVSMSTVELDAHMLTNEARVVSPEATPGPYVCIRVSDTGQGIDEQTQKRIFEPYFTTKKIGEGTGLGLATVHGIVQNHGGVIRLRSTVNQGTAFDVYFPLCDREQVAPGARASIAPLKGSECILFVDDEEQINLLAEMALADLGYQVHSRASSIEALEAFRANPDRFDVVVTDQTMPQLTGGELAKKMLEIRPDLPIVLCTGYSDALTAKMADKLGIREYVTKPVITRELAAAIRRALRS